MEEINREGLDAVSQKKTREAEDEQVQRKIRPCEAQAGRSRKTQLIQREAITTRGATSAFLLRYPHFSSENC
ncbi:hypothetical protein AMECASPLE_003935 [Ameca splendens]|uniref:Uncharacterized protein n=1 Tax=Ameca splendens TaxID=208324 RepID=A0ABV0XMT5_9TELE